MTRRDVVGTCVACGGCCVVRRVGGVAVSFCGDVGGCGGSVGIGVGIGGEGRGLGGGGYLTDLEKDGLFSSF